MNINLEASSAGKQHRIVGCSIRPSVNDKLPKDSLHKWIVTKFNPAYVRFWQKRHINPNTGTLAHPKHA